MTDEPPRGRPPVRPAYGAFRPWMAGVMVVLGLIGLGLLRLAGP